MITLVCILGLTIATVLIGIIQAVKWLFFPQATGFSVFALTSVLLGIILGLLGTFVVPNFKVVFESFGADLPTLTKLVLDFRYFLWAPLFLIAISWQLLRAHKARGIYYQVCFLVETLLLCLVLWALYYPIFKLSAVQGG
jgi:hypothetical protein